MSRINKTDHDLFYAFAKLAKALAPNSDSPQAALRQRQASAFALKYQGHS
jgi:hypothetical protein